MLISIVLDIGCVFAFDLIYIRTINLFSASLWKKRELLKKNFKEVDLKFRYVQSVDSDSFEKVEEFLIQYLKVGAEGLMVQR